jgi:hypothetical protein
MFKWHGILGIFIIIFVEINFLLKIEPFASWYFPLVWLGYILVVDALVYKIRGNSLISNRFPMFLGMVILSALFWWVFEFANLTISNWGYEGLEKIGDIAKGAASPTALRTFFGTIAFATVLPAFFETVELIRSIHLFDKVKLKKKYKISKTFLHIMIILGIISLILPIVLPRYAFPLVWLSFFLLLDPINYMHKQPSIIGHLKDRRLAIPLALLLAGIIMGFFWEFWNYWAGPKWTYNIDLLNNFKILGKPILSYKIFEMYWPGYLGYFPFAFELYAMYWFARSLFLKKEKLLID